MELPVKSPRGTVYAIVDVEDFDSLSSKNWTLNRWGYAVRGVWTDKTSRAYMMHREVLGLPVKASGEEVDHINHDKLDNRKANLRVVDKSANGLNKKTFKTNQSGHRGVLWEARIKRWRVFVTQDGKRKSLGCHQSFGEAVKVYHDFVLAKHTQLFCCK